MITFSKHIAIIFYVKSVKVYNEDGRARPLRTILNTPGSNAVSIKNDGRLEFPFAANVQASPRYHNAQSAHYNHMSMMNPNSNNMHPPSPSISQGTRRNYSQTGEQGISSKIIQGGAAHSISFKPPVSSVQVTLTTEGRPLIAQVELLQGPTSAKQVWEVDSQDGEKRPFSAIIESAMPGASFAIRVKNTGQMEVRQTHLYISFPTFCLANIFGSFLFVKFPIVASIKPYEYDQYGMDGGYGQNMYWS